MTITANRPLFYLTFCFILVSCCSILVQGQQSLQGFANGRGIKPEVSIDPTNPLKIKIKINLNGTKLPSSGGNKNDPIVFYMFLDINRDNELAKELVLSSLKPSPDYSIKVSILNSTSTVTNVKSYPPECNECYAAIRRQVNEGRGEVPTSGEDPDNSFPAASSSSSASHEDTYSSSSSSSSSSSPSSTPTSNWPNWATNFKKTYGIITIVSSLFGLICVILCGVYFILVFPLKMGTTVLGWVILVGVAIVYAVNLLFLLPPSVVGCASRKIMMSLGYSAILSAMLVKVINTWRRQNFKPKREEDLKLTSPSHLFCMAGVLIGFQVTMTLIWLVLVPPEPEIVSGSLRCHSRASSIWTEMEAAASGLYLLCIVCFIFLFCFLTWKSFDNNRESRFIFYSTLMISLIWVSWFAFLKINEKPRNTDPQYGHSSLGSSSPSPAVVSSASDVTVICANLACASFVMILLYLRKLYWFSKVRRKEQLIRNRLQQGNFPSNFYGAFHRNTHYPGAYPWDAMSYASGGHSTTASSVRGSIHSVSGMNRKGGPQIPGRGNKQPFEDEEEETMSCGSAASSVQVQGTDLYPMDVYDGGSQFAPASLFGSSGGGRPEGTVNESK